MMRKVFLMLFVLMSFNSFSQLQVKEGSFKRDGSAVIDDVDINYDDNYDPMALIKISTVNINEAERMRLAFKSNRATQIKKDYLNGQVWLYISKAADFLEISHPDYSLITYKLPETLCGFCVYDMILEYISPSSSSEYVQQKKYPLIVKADQSNATIYIDDELLDIGEAYKTVDEGTTHTYKIECNLYHTETGTVTVNDRTVINKTLRPAFGYINVSTSPEQDAKVFVDGNYLGLSPIKTDKLASGTHTVRVMKEMFKMKEQSFTVNDGQTTNANITMEANFVNVTVNTDSQSDIYVDEEYKGKGRWTGRVSDGSHIFEARKTNHRPTNKTVDLVLGETKTITLDAPKPINGSCEISSSPMGATIYIDGKSYGETPNYINDIIIGTHELKLEKQGCTPITKTISIKEGETLSVNEKLQTGKEISISTDKTSDEIYLDVDNKSTQLHQNFTPRKDNLDKYLDRGIDFITLNAAYSVAPQISFGFTYGQVKKIGWFVSAMTGTGFEGFNMNGRSYEEAALTGETASSRLSITGGVALRLGTSPVYLKAGAGYGMRVRTCETIHGDYVEYTPDTYKGLEMTAGLQFNLKKITLGVDAVTTNFKYLELKLGVGINWN